MVANPQLSKFTSRPYTGAADLALLIQFAEAVGRARAPAPSYYHPGDFVWQLYAFDRSDDVRIWTSAGDHRIAACAIFEPPLTFQFEIEPTAKDRPELMAELFEWAEGRRAALPLADKDAAARAYAALGTRSISTSALDTDIERIEALTQHGYVRHHTETSFKTSRRLDGELSALALPRGARFRHIADDDIAARAELHRDAWSVWGESEHTEERYRRLRGAPLYDPELDVVLEYDGQLVSYCICWPDNTNRVGLFEPVGTRPSVTRRGFGRALLYEAFRRLREHGMATAVVSTGTVNHPALELYTSAGFEVHASEHTYVKSDAE